MQWGLLAAVTFLSVKLKLNILQVQHPVCLGCVVRCARKKGTGSEGTPYSREADSTAAFVQAM